MRYLVNDKRAGDLPVYKDFLRFRKSDDFIDIEVTAWVKENDEVCFMCPEIGKIENMTYHIVTPFINEEEKMSASFCNADYANCTVSMFVDL